MPSLSFTLTERVAVLASLGLVAWVIAFSRIYISLSNQDASNTLFLLSLGLANGLFFLLNTLWLGNQILKNKMHWVINNRDAICWLFILGGYSCILIIHQQVSIKPLDELLISFMIIIFSTQVIRFSAYLGIPLLLSVTAIYTLQIDDPDRLFIGLYILTQQLVLWSLGMGVFYELNESKRLKVSQAQLKMAQSQLAITSRQQERQQISHDLHDKMGHDLASLHINLQICEHQLSEYQRSGPKQRPLNDAQNACQRLFETLSIVVSDLRQPSEESFYDALLQMIDNAPGLEVELEHPPQLIITDTHLAGNLLCCIQEGLTNVLKHSNARHVSIRIIHANNQLRVNILDNGNNANQIQPGNGLQGMQERLLSIDGHADCTLLDNKNVNLYICLPMVLTT